MPATIIDCSWIASELEKELDVQYSGMKDILGFKTIITGPSTTVQDGIESPTPQKPSWKYSEMLGRDCQKYGVRYESILRETDNSLRATINMLNNDHSTHGILVLSPHPPKITVDRHDLANMVDMSKDVEGLSHYHKGKLEQKYDQLGIVPPTAGAIISILDHYDYQYTRFRKSKNALIINRSEVLGKPLRNMLEHKGMFVVSSDVNTSDDVLASIIPEMDLIVTAVPTIPGHDYKMPVQSVRQGAAVIAVNSQNISNTADHLYYDILQEKCTLLTTSKDPIGKITCKITLENLYRLALHK